MITHGNANFILDPSENKNVARKSPKTESIALIEQPRPSKTIEDVKANEKNVKKEKTIGKDEKEAEMLKEAESIGYRPLFAYRRLLAKKRRLLTQRYPFIFANRRRFVTKPKVKKQKPKRRYYYYRRRPYYEIDHFQHTF